MTAANYLREFHRKFDLPTEAQVTDSPTVLSGPDLELRKTLIKEEYEELMEALDEEEDLFHIYKEMADLVYVIYGLDVKMGGRLDAVLRIIHHSNMSKVNSDGTVTRRESDNKVIKPDHYEIPDLTEALS